MAFLLFANWWKFVTKKFSYIINIYFKFSEEMIRFIMISKIKILKIQIFFVL
jgi:hypothetical protein